VQRRVDATGRRRWRRDRRALPEDWPALTAASLTHWAVLDDDERAALGELMGQIAERRWEAANGFALTDEITVTIAAQAALLVLELGIDCYRDVTAIVVHPTTVTLRGERAGPAPGVRTDAPLPVVGQTRDRRGPVLIAWDAARAGARHPERGYNVVLHEFAHKLDMLDGLVDGTPPLPDPVARRRWIDVCTAEYRRLRAGEGGHVLRGYAGVNPGEFFAVATEVFFDRPIELRAEAPDLYDVLRAFYRQDPVARAARTPRR
jgi:MtfA peptidase